MAAYDAKTLLARWKMDEITTEMAVGQLVQLLVMYEERLQALERRSDPPQPGQ